MEIALIAPTAVVSALVGAFVVLSTIEVSARPQKLPSVITKRIREINKQEIKKLAKQLTKKTKRI